MKKNAIILILMGVLATTSCNEDLLDKTNTNQQTLESYYKTEFEILLATNGIYPLLQGNALGGREWYFLHDMRGDEVVGTGGLEAHRRQLLEGNHSTSNDIIRMTWSAFYRIILRANAVIVNAPTAIFDNENLRSRSIGEAKFLRAYAYYELYTLWGSVPIYTEPSTSLAGAKPRSPMADVKALMVADFTDAISKLPSSYPATDLGRATKIAAQAMLAKLYMFDGQYDLAKPLLEEVIAEGEAIPANMGNPLMANYFDNFTEEAEFNKESIWEIGYNADPGGYNWDADGNGKNNETWNRSQEYAATGWRNLVPSPKLLNEYEPGDPRKEDSIYELGDLFGDPSNPGTLTTTNIIGGPIVVNGVDRWPSFRKYTLLYKTQPLDHGKFGVNFRMLRYAEMYLLLAECENELDAPEATVLTYLNKTRLRPSVNMPPYPTAEYPTGTKAERFAAIMHERMIELAGEEKRNVDILRWRKNGKLTSEPISYFTPNKYELLPLPVAEIDNNEFIEQADQNPGYQ